jgi:hypothetical protein
MAGLMNTVEYISDDGSTYRIRMDASNATAISATPVTGPANLPGRYRPRYILCKLLSTGRERKIICPDPTSALWLGTTDAITLVDFSTTPSTSQAHVALGRVGEKRYG